MNTEEIRQKYLALHNALGSQKDAADKDEFDRQHREIWGECDAELRERKAELEAKSILTDEERVELGELEMTFPMEAPPSRDLGAEMDEIKAKIADYDNLKARVERLEKK